MDGFRERLTAPLGWWLAALVFGLICGWVMLVAADPMLGVVAAALTSVAASAVVWAYGNVAIRVEPPGLTVGEAFLSSDAIGEVVALDRSEVRAHLGPDADARAWLRIRPYVDGGVRIAVADPADPAPYWLVSSRRPGELAAALRVVGQTEVAHDEGNRR